MCHTIPGGYGRAEAPPAQERPPHTPNLYTRTLNNAVLTASLHYPGDAGCLTMCVMAKALHLTRPLSISACVSFSHTWFQRP